MWMFRREESAVVGPQSTVGKEESRQSTVNGPMSEVSQLTVDSSPQLGF